jgi:hypothetical protein
VDDGIVGVTADGVLAGDDGLISLVTVSGTVTLTTE